MSQLGKVSLIYSICGFISQHFFILKLEIYIDVTKKIAFVGFNEISVTECAFYGICEVVFIRSIKYQSELFGI